MKYRKKPVVIEAMQFNRENIKELEKFTNNKIKKVLIEKRIDGIATCEIETLEDTMNAKEGDYIIKGINGEFYPCKPDIFKKTYEECE